MGLPTGISNWSSLTRRTGASFQRVDGERVLVEPSLDPLQRLWRHIRTQGQFGFGETSGHPYLLQSVLGFFIAV